MSTCLHECTTYVLGIHKGQKSCLELFLDLLGSPRAEVIDSRHVSTGIECMSSRRAVMLLTEEPAL